MKNASMMASAAPPVPAHSFVDFIQLRSLRAEAFKLRRDVNNGGVTGVFLILALRNETRS